MRKLITSALVRLAIVLVAFVLASGSVAAQKSRPIPPPPGSNTSEEPKPRTPVPERRSVEQATFEMHLLLARRTRETDLARERKRIAAQLNRSFQRLAQINAEKIRPLTTAQTFDYRAVARMASEVKECAMRIKFNSPLGLKDKTGEKIRYETTSQLGPMLPELSRLINSFLENPALYVNSPDDAQLLSAAGHDLESIIKLSDTINKTARRLSKSEVPSR